MGGLCDNVRSYFCSFNTVTWLVILCKVTALEMLVTVSVHVLLLYNKAALWSDNKLSRPANALIMHCLIYTVSICVFSIIHIYIFHINIKQIPEMWWTLSICAKPTNSSFSPLFNPLRLLLFSFNWSLSRESMVFLAWLVQHSCALSWNIWANLGSWI